MGRTKTLDFNKIVWQPLLVLYNLFCILQSIVEAGGTTAGPTGETKTPFELRGLLKQKKFKESCECISDDRGVFSPTVIRPLLLAAALVSELHVTFLHAGKQLI